MTSIGPLADKLYRLRARRLKKQQEVDAMKREEQELHGMLFDQFREHHLDSVRGRVATVSVQRNVVPQVTDWPTFFKWAKRKGNDDCLPKSVNSAAWRERYTAGVEVPGTEPFSRVSLSITKR